MDQELDISYFANTLASLTGIPVRLYIDSDKPLLFSNVTLVKDPIVLYEKEILSKQDNVAYFLAKDFSYYGILNHKRTKLVIGPTRLLPFDENSIHEMIFALNVSKEDIPSFENAMKSIITMPLESLILTLLSFNYALNGEKLSLKDVIINEPAQESLKKSLATNYAETHEFDSPVNGSVHNTYDIENSMLKIIKEGDSLSLQEFIKHAPAMRAGVVAPNSLRQDKNIFIVSTTLASRAAIKGGLSVNEALSLSDLYIQRCELLQDSSSILELQFRMVTDYCEMVNKIRGKEPLSSLGLKVSEYVYSHIHEPIRLDELAKSLYMSKSNLCLRFKKETGMTIEQFVSSRKIATAKELLSNTNKSLLSIAMYLGYSSQAHFSKAFLSLVKLTPSKYRKEHYVN
jgi:AraC-like DNA-binding protein